MESKRQLQVAELIKRNFSVVLQQEGRYLYGDQALVTVTQVKMSSDLGLAKIYLSVFNTENKQAVILQLEQESTRLRKSLSQRIRKHVRRIPHIDMYEECRELMESCGAEAPSLTPLIFRVITDVVASDRFVSAAEANYLSSMSKKLELSIESARSIFKQAMADRRGRLEVSPSSIDEMLHPHLKELLSFDGAESLVGPVEHDSVEEKAIKAMESGKEDISLDDVERAMTVLGLSTNATLGDAEKVWMDTIDTLNLPKMANLGETFVSAAISRISRINEAYKTILHFHESL